MSECANPLNLEFVAEKSDPHDGWRHDRVLLPTNAWRLGADGLSLTGASTPAAVLLTVSSVAGEDVIQWAANAANTVQAGTSFLVPGEYGKDAKIMGSRLADDFVLLANMRRQRNAADAAAWNARCTVIWYTPGTSTTAFNTLTTNPTAVVPTISADNTALLTGFSTLTFDIGARLRAEGKRISAGDKVRLLLGPDTANANSVLQFSGGNVRCRCHAALASRSARN